MSDQVVMNLMGGLGNQLFQYAAGLRISEDLGGHLYLLPAHSNHHSTRDYRLLFPRAFRDPPPRMREAYYNQPDAFAAWSPTMFKGVNSIELQGYWQYLPAIQHLLPIIEFDLFDSLSSLRTELGIQYGSHDCVGFVHIRRGDYVDKSHIHHLQQEDYYQVGMKSVEAHRYVKRWRVFSDDLEWCKQQPWLQGPRFEFIDEPDELRSLMLMSMCPAGAVIANSTFSWWGAMLGPSKTGIVVYPSKWLLEAKPILFPSHWIKYGP